jgi:predicted ester cyclase
MGIEENKAILRYLFEEVWNNNNLGAVDECFADNFIRHNIGGGTLDLNAYKQFLVRIRDSFPDIHRTLDDIVAEGDMIAFSFKWTGTDTGGFGGNPPTGKYLTVPEGYFARFENSKIVEIKQYADRLGMAQELGIIPTTEEIQKTRKETKTIEENKKVVVRFFDALRIADISAIDKLTTDDFVFHAIGGGNIYKVNFLKLINGTLTAFPDHTSTIDDMIAEGDKVSVRMTSTGTHTGQYGKFAPTGKYFSIPEFFILRVENGRIVEYWGLKDALGQLQQLGIIPPNEETGK